MLYSINGWVWDSEIARSVSVAVVVVVVGCVRFVKTLCFIYLSGTKALACHGRKVPSSPLTTLFITPHATQPTHQHTHKS